MHFEESILSFLNTTTELIRVHKKRSQMVFLWLHLWVYLTPLQHVSLQVKEQWPAVCL